MHVTVCIALLVCVLCQSVHSCIETSLHELDFFFEFFLWRLASDKINFFQIVARATHVLVVDASFAHVCTDKWHPTASTLCPLSLPHNKAQVKRYTYCVTALGWLKKERKGMNDSNFRPFQVCHFKTVTTLCYYYCRLGQVL